MNLSNQKNIEQNQGDNSEKKRLFSKIVERRPLDSISKFFKKYTPTKNECKTQPKEATIKILILVAGILLIGSLLFLLFWIIYWVCIITYFVVKTAIILIGLWFGLKLIAALPEERYYDEYGNRIY